MPALDGRRVMQDVFCEVSASFICLNFRAFKIGTPFDQL
jgi:hypothetical protein